MSVTPPKPKDNLAVAAARLSKAAPNSWTEFMDAFTTLTREHEIACVRAKADEVLIAQGMARKMADLLILFDNAAKQK